MTKEPITTTFNTIRENAIRELSPGDGAWEIVRNYLGKTEPDDESLKFKTILEIISDYSRDNGNFDQLESQQAQEMLRTGYGFLDTNITYERNPDGEIEGKVIQYNEIFRAKKDD